MATAETLLTLCLPDAVQRTALLAKSRESLSVVAVADTTPDG